MVAVTTLLCSGCRSAERSLLVTGSESIAWPRPPARARVEYVGSIDAGYGERLQENRELGEFLLGELLLGERVRPRLVSPHSLAIHPETGVVAVADPQAGCIHVFDPRTSSGETIGGEGDDSRSLTTPVGVAWLGTDLLIADAGEGHIVSIRLGGSKAAATARSWGSRDLERPSGIAVSFDQQEVYVVDAAAHAVVVFDAGGEVLRRIGERGSRPGTFNFPAQIAVDRDGHLVITDALNFRVQRITRDGEVMAVFGRKGNAGGDFALPKGIAVDSGGRLWVSDGQFENIQAFDAEGRLLMAFGREGRGPGEFWLPAGLAIDKEDRLWVADSYNRRIQVFRILP